MTPLFKSLVVSRATPSISTRSLKSLPHIAAFRAESQALVNMARSGVRLGHFELNLSIPALSGPVARPLAEDQIPQELVVRGLGDPPFRSVPRHVGLDLLPEIAFPLAAIQPRAFVLRDVVPYGLQGCSPHHVVVRASSPSHVDVHGQTHFATRPRAE